MHHACLKLAPFSVLGIVGTSLLLAACGGAEEPSPFELSGASSALDQRLEADTGSEWQVCK